MDWKRKRIDVDLSDEFSPEDLECAEILLSLRTCSTPSSSSSSKCQKHKEPKILIRPPKPQLRDDLPSIDSIIGKFTHRYTGYGNRDVVIIRKRLTYSDTVGQQARLAILHSDFNKKVKEDFLIQEESDVLEKTYSNGRKGQIRVKVRGCFSEKEHNMTMSKWYYKNKGYFKYALTGGWNPFRIENGLEYNDEITVAAVRSEDVLCLTIHGGRRQKAKPAPIAVAAPAPCLLTWHTTLPRGAKGADWKHVEIRPNLITC